MNRTRNTIIALCMTLAGCAGEDGGGDDGAAGSTATGGVGSTSGGSVDGDTGDDPDDAPPNPDDSDGDDATTESTESTESTDGTADDGPADSSSGGGSEVLVGCYDYDAFAASAVSYRDDVMPIFAANCASCHQDPSASVYFGMGGTTEGEAAAIYDKLLSGEPKQAPHLNFIVPFDPVRSYMMAKVEYDDPGGTCSVIVCSEPGCELQAPPSAQLPEPQLAILRSWVLGGALND